MANFGPLSRGQPHSPDVNHCVLHFRPEGHREPHNKVGSLSPVERLVGFEPQTSCNVRKLTMPKWSEDFQYFE